MQEFESLEVYETDDKTRCCVTRGRLQLWNKTLGLKPAGAEARPQLQSQKCRAFMATTWREELLLEQKLPF